MVHVCTHTHVHRHAHMTHTHEHSTQSGAQRFTRVPTCTCTFSHMQKHTQANSTFTNTRMHRPVTTETHSHRCRRTHLCTHTHAHLPGWSLREGICLPVPCFRPLGFWAHAHFHHWKKKSSPTKLSLVPQGKFIPIASSITPPILGPQAKSFHFKEKSLSPNWAAALCRPVWGRCFAHPSLRYRKVTQSS